MEGRWSRDLSEVYDAQLALEQQVNRMAPSPSLERQEPSPSSQAQLQPQLDTVSHFTVALQDRITMVRLEPIT